MKKRFGFKELFSLISIPILYGGIYLTNVLFPNPITIQVAYSVITLLLFICLIIAFRKLLRAQWREFCEEGKSKWLIIIIGAILLQVVISLAGSIFPSVQGETSALVAGRDYDFLEVSWNFYFILLFASIGPIAMALIEDMVFKHTLLEKLLSNSKILNILLVLVNSVLFGAIHYANFGNRIINTIPFMFAGLFLNLIYLWKRNLWHVLLIHFLNNFVLSGLSIIFLGIIRIFI
ncbi:CPBP family intramembrane glutamic endopeptidase [Oceanobacillus locisalsi]|uniref:CPBP family intramembrane glutamic endopeptidase n=1 Tax=Oceanobacillus locisalsi TaxID=546107 RepID=A0ABW3NB91_9BACI